MGVGGTHTQVLYIVSVHVNSTTRLLTFELCFWYQDEWDLAADDLGARKEPARILNKKKVVDMLCWFNLVQFTTLLLRGTQRAGTNSQKTNVVDMLY